ncbi:MAG TPA: hypothetical protein VND45_04095 [Thermoanaerobaculia bacterium]|jgi:hypothetical protein|nr:hypothetical protein [Thermoanaerobaculia bacterium]
MTEPKPVELSEDRIPFDGIEETIDELVEMYGGEMTARRDQARDFILPLRRGAGGSGVECTVSWAADDERDATVTLLCNRNIDAPKAQRVFLLTAGVVGAVLFMLWPFFPHERAWGSVAWLGGIIAIAVYLMTLRKSSGGVAFDFLQRLAERQRSAIEQEA